MSRDPGLVADYMAVSLARLVGPEEVIGVGLGTPLALVAALVARELPGAAVHVLAGGALDVTGDVDVWMGGPAATAGRTPGYVSHFESMDMAERQAMTLQFLRPAQVDARGNLNTSRIGPRFRPRVRFPGGLATADVPMLLPRVVVYHPEHRRRSLPERVDWVTGAGGGWRGSRLGTAGTVAVVTDLAVIDFTGEDARVASIHPWSDAGEVADNTGFELQDLEAAPVTPGPDDAERAALEKLDPNRRRDGEVPVAGVGGRTGVRG